jgi:hypothetical protein
MSLVAKAQGCGGGVGGEGGSAYLGLRWQCLSWFNILGSGGSAYLGLSSIKRLAIRDSDGSVVECRSRDWEVMGLIPGRVTT